MFHDIMLLIYIYTYVTFSFEFDLTDKCMLMLTSLDTSSTWTLELDAVYSRLEGCLHLGLETLSQRCLEVVVPLAEEFLEKSTYFFIGSGEADTAAHTRKRGHV